MRASSALNRQLTGFAAAFLRRSQAATSRRSVSRSCILRSRYCRARTLISISAMSVQLPCRGVWWTSNPLARREASAGAKASYSVESLWVSGCPSRARSSFPGSGHRRCPGQAGKVLFGAAFGDPAMALAERRGMGHEQVGGAVALVLTGVPCRPPRPCRHRYPGLFCQMSWVSSMHTSTASS